MKKSFAILAVLAVASVAGAQDVLQPSFVKTTTAQNSSSVPVIGTVFGGPMNLNPPTTGGDAEIFMIDPTNDNFAVLFNGNSTGDGDGSAIVRYELANITNFALVAGADINTAIDAANGADPAPTDVTIRDAGVNAAGQVIVLLDPTGAGATLAFLARVTFSGSTGTVDIIGSGANVDGGESLAVVGNTAYVAKQGSFAGGTSADNAIIAFDTTGGAAVASQTGTIVITNTDLTNAGIATPDNINAIAANGTSLLIGVAADYYSASFGPLAITPVKTSAAIQTELGLTALSTSNNSLVVDAAGNIFFQPFSTTPATVGNSFIKIGTGAGRPATVYLSETTIEADADFKTTIGGATTAELEANGRNFGFSDLSTSTTNGALVFSNESSDDTVWTVTNPSNVADWMVF